MRDRQFRRVRPARRLKLLDWLAGFAVLALLFFAGQELQRRFVTPEELAGFGEAVDGDSLLLSGQKVRLKGIDAPELAQMCQDRMGRDYACGLDAKRWLRAKLLRGAVTCRIEGRDRYGRMLGVCSMREEVLNAAIVREGIAVSYGDYRTEEREAQRSQAGLWAGRFIAPSEWRASHPRDHETVRAN